MGDPREREKSINQRGRKTVLRLPAGSQWLSSPPPPIHAEAAKALWEWPSLPHLGVTMVSCQEWLRRGDIGEVGPLLANVR